MFIEYELKRQPRDSIDDARSVVPNDELVAEPASCFGRDQSDSIAAVSRVLIGPPARWRTVKPFFLVGVSIVGWRD